MLFYVFYAIDKIFNLRMAFRPESVVYLCKNETIEENMLYGNKKVRS